MVSRPRPDQPEKAIFRLIRRIRDLETMVYGRSSSVTNGQTRFIGTESLIVIGSQLVSGLLHVVGRITISGLGILEVLGLIRLTGTMQVQSGGEITIGNVSIKDGKITVGTGGGQVVIDGATGKITAGDLTIDPTVSGGAVTFANGAQVFTDASSIQVFKGSSVVQIENGSARLQTGGDVIEIDTTGMRASLGAVSPISGTGAVARTIMQDTNGYFRRADGT